MLATSRADVPYSIALEVAKIVKNDESLARGGQVSSFCLREMVAEEPISFSAPINQLMSRPVVTIHPNASLQDALQTMQARNIRRLLVMSDDGNNMVGIITDNDIFRFVTRNQPLSPAFVNDEALARSREMAERFNSSLFDEIMRRRQQ